MSYFLKTHFSISTLKGKEQEMESFLIYILFVALGNYIFTYNYTINRREKYWKITYAYL